MRKILGLAVVGLLAAVSAAQAAPIVAGSELSLNGDDTFTATSITFTGSGNIGGDSNSFAGLASCNGCVTMTSFMATTATPFTLYSATNNGLTTTLSVSSDTFSFTGGTIPSLNISGTGTLNLTGFDPTPGTFLLTTQGTGGTITFSETAVASAVPEPLTLSVFGAGLVGAAALRRRKKAKA